MVLQTDNLTKTYHGIGGCRQVCLSLGAGQAFGLLGPNGAGKSTLVKTLLGLLPPESGEAQLLGRPLQDIAMRGQLGYLPENFRYHPWLTGQELVELHGKLCGLRGKQLKENAQRGIKMAGMEAHQRRKVGTYSKGMQQRIGLACALVNRPALIFLDEPTSALDPVGRRDVRKLIIDLKEQGTTVFLNSHLLGEVESVCDQVAVMIGGRIVQTGPPASLLQPKGRLRFTAQGISEELMRRLEMEFGSVNILQPGEYLLEVADIKQAAPVLASWLVTHGAMLYELQMERESLEDAFIRLVEHGFGGVTCSSC